MSRGWDQPLNQPVIEKRNLSLCVIGFPSTCGGAETELDHQITCWRQMGVDVSLIPTSPLDEKQLALGVAERGCTIHDPCDWSKCRGKHVLSYCNGIFLQNIREACKFAASTTFVNCMTYPFQAEKDAICEGLIDFSLYQAEHTRELATSQIPMAPSSWKPVVVRPFFDVSQFPFVAHDIFDHFSFCRVSRADPAKYSKATNRIYEGIRSPNGKKGWIVGVDDAVRAKIGESPDWIDCFEAGKIDPRLVYERSHCLIQAADTYENLPRVGMEAMSSGCVPIVDNRGGWREIVEHGVTGYLCGNPEDFIERASELASDPLRRSEMASAGRKRVESLYGIEPASRQWANFFDLLEPPSLIDKAFSMLSVTAGTVLEMFRGNPGLLPPSSIAGRLEHCNSCDSLQGGKCTRCGCCTSGHQNWLNKLAHPTAECPIGKW